MNWEEVEQILYNIHCRACDGYGCDHGDKVAEALAALKELAAQQSAQADSDPALLHCEHGYKENHCPYVLCKHHSELPEHHA